MTYPHGYRICMRSDGMSREVLELADVLGAHGHPSPQKGKTHFVVDHEFSFLSIPVNQTHNVPTGFLNSSCRNQKTTLVLQIHQLPLLADINKAVLLTSN